jgi:hypothetical protein
MAVARESFVDAAKHFMLIISEIGFLGFQCQRRLAGVQVLGWNGVRIPDRYVLGSLKTKAEICEEDLADISDGKVTTNVSQRRISSSLEGGAQLSDEYLPQLSRLPQGNSKRTMPCHRRWLIVCD